MVPVKWFFRLVHIKVYSHGVTETPYMSMSWKCHVFFLEMIILNYLFNLENTAFC